MKILIDKNNIILSISDTVQSSTTEPGVIFMNGAGFGLSGQQVVEVASVPDHVSPSKYKYIDDEFVINEDYRDSTQEQELINTLGQELASLKIQLIMGGVI